MKQFAKAIFVATLSASLLAAAQAGSARYAITPQQISLMLRESGVDVSPEHVHLPMTLTSASEAPALRVIGAERAIDGNVRVRLRCTASGECVPFTAILDTRAISPDAFHLLSLNSPSAAGRPLPVRAQAMPVVQVPSPTHLVHPAVQPGDHVSMLLRDGNIQVQFPVIALDSGRVGGSIRVSTPDHSHTYRSVVIDASTVQGIVE